MLTRVTQPLMTRTEALQRRDLRRAWLLLALGLLIPLIALWGAYEGWTARKASPRLAWTIVALGVVIFAVRLALFVG
jgi:FtsH-binding integral membrane protein